MKGLIILFILGLVIASGFTYVSANPETTESVVNVVNAFREFVKPTPIKTTGDFVEYSEIKQPERENLG